MKTLIFAMLAALSTAIPINAMEQKKTSTKSISTTAVLAWLPDPTPSLPTNLDTLPNETIVNIINHALDPMLSDIHKALDGLVTRYNLSKTSLFDALRIVTYRTVFYKNLTPIYITLENIVQFRSNFIRTTGKLAWFKEYLDKKITKELRRIRQDFKNLLLLLTVYFNQNTDIASLLLKIGARSDIDMPDIESMNRISSSDLAIQKDSVPLLELFIQYGTQLHIHALDRAARFNALHAATFMLENLHINPNNLVLSSTPVFVAVQKGYLTMVQLLIKNEANINIRNGFGKTPLSLSDNPEITEFLLTHGANPKQKVKDDSGKEVTVLELHLQKLPENDIQYVEFFGSVDQFYRQLQVIEILKKYGA